MLSLSQSFLGVQKVLVGIKCSGSPQHRGRQEAVPGSGHKRSLSVRSTPTLAGSLTWTLGDWQGGHPGCSSGLGLGRGGEHWSAVARTPRTLGAWGSLRLRVRALVMLAGLRWGVHEPWGCANVFSSDVHVSGEGSPRSLQPTKRHELLTTRASQNEPELRPSS